MQFIFDIIKRNGAFLIFILLECAALFLVFQNNIYHNTFFNETSTTITGYVNNKINDVTNYIRLPETNENLLKENALLRSKLTNFYADKKNSNLINKVDSSFNKNAFGYIPTNIINNSIIKTQNYLTIDKGSNQGVEKGDGIVTSKGVIGIITYAGKNYSRAISLLNKNIQINARIRGNDYFGTLIWDGKDPRFVQLTEIPKYISVKKGDIIETDGKSPVFPEGIAIGKVVYKNIDNVSGELKIQIRLFQDFANLANAYVITNLNKAEINKVEKSDSIITNVQ